MLKLWKYNQRTGYWDLQRTITSPEDGQRWLDIFQKDEPQEHFVLSKTRPSKPPTMKSESVQRTSNLHLTPTPNNWLTFKEFVHTIVEAPVGLTQGGPGSSTVWEAYLADALTAAANVKGFTNTKNHTATVRRLALKHLYNERWKDVVPAYFNVAVDEIARQQPQTAAHEMLGALLLDPEFNAFDTARQLWVYSQTTQQYEPRPTASAPKRFHEAVFTREFKQLLRTALEDANREWRAYKEDLARDPNVNRELQKNIARYYPKTSVFTSTKNSKTQKFRFTSDGITSAEHQKFAESAYKIATELVKTMPALKGRIFHAVGAETAHISDVYRVYGGSDATSKSDIISIPDGYRFSLKNADTGSRLADSQAPDGLAMFNLAKDRYSASSSKRLTGINALETTFRNALEDVDFSQLGKDVVAKLAAVIDMKHADKPGSGKPGVIAVARMLYQDKPLPPKVAAVLAKYPAANELFETLALKDIAKDEVGPVLAETLRKNKDFMQILVYENATGAGKFGGPNAPLTDTFPLGSANYLLTFGPKEPTDKRANKIETIETWDSKAIEALSSQIKLSIRWRHITPSKATTSAKYDILPEKNSVTLESLYREEVNQLLLSEGVFDTVTNAYNVVADTASDWWNRLKTWWQGFVTKVLQQLRAAAEKGLNAVLDFLDLEAEEVKIDGPGWLFS